MTQVTFKSNLVEIKGTLDNMVFKRSPQGEIILSKKPDMSKLTWSEAQMAQRQCMKQASKYAKTALAGLEVRLHDERQAK